MRNLGGQRHHNQFVYDGNDYIEWRKSLISSSNNMK